jgi:pilus assembly protein Flp/PilA
MINKKLFSREEGQGLVEYALILVLVAIVVIAVLLLLGPAINQTFCKVANTLKPGTCGIIQATTSNTPGGMGTVNVTITVTVSQAASVTVAVNNGTPTSPQSCTPSSCPSFTFNNIPTGGSYTVRASDGSVITGSY